MTLQQNFLNYATGALTTAIVFAIFRPTAEPAVASPPAKPDADQLPAQIAAERFVVRDKRGRTVATLGHSDKPEDGIGLHFYDNVGTERLGVSIIPGNGYEPYVLLRDANGAVRIALNVCPQNCASIELFTADGKPALYLGTNDAVGSSILLSGENGKPRALLASSAAVLPAAEKTAKNTDKQHDKDGLLIFFDESGRKTSRLPMR